MTPRTLSDPTIGEGVLEPTEPVKTLIDAIIQKRLNEIYADLLIYGTIRAEPGMDWFHAEITSSRESEDDCPF